MGALVRVKQLNQREKKRFSQYVKPMRSSLTKYRQATVKRAPNFQKALLVTAGGASAGAVNAYMPTLGGVVPTTLAAGSVLVALSLYLGSDKNPSNDKMAYGLLMLGSGMLAVSASDYVESMITNQQITSPTLVAVAQ